MTKKELTLTYIKGLIWGWWYMLLKGLILRQLKNMHTYENLNTVLMHFLVCLFEVLRPSQPNGVMSSAVSLPNHTFTGQA